jgi:putative (di)nucleoside polyphosphate hydrolase
MLYRPCVGIALFNQQGQVFVGERIDTPGAWQMPQGGIDPGEDIAEAAMRELSEEVGTRHARIIKIIDETVRYDLPPDLRKKLWGGRYAGQEQTWVVARFDGQDSDINLTAGDVGIPAEFSQWKWVSLEDTVSLIVPFKREAYRRVIALIAPHKPVSV